MAQNAAATIRSELQAIEGALLLTEVLSKKSASDQITTVKALGITLPDSVPSGDD